MCCCLMLHNTGVHRRRCCEAALAVCELRGMDLGNYDVFICISVLGFFFGPFFCITTSALLNIIFKA